MNIDNRVANIVYTFGPIWTTEVIALYASQYDAGFEGDSVKGAVWRLAEAKVIDWNTEGKLVMVGSQ